MTEKRTFSHITVTPHEEDEVVIHVGASAPTEQPSRLEQTNRLGPVLESPAESPAERSKQVAADGHHESSTTHTASTDQAKASPLTAAHGMVDARAVAGADVLADADAHAVADGGTPADADVRAVVGADAPAKSSGTNKRDAYQETTLEDLEGHPLSLTHKIVIVAAVLLLVGFAVYCAFLM